MGNRLEINRILKQYKQPTGQPNFPALLSIPMSERLPAMVKNDYQGTFIMITGAITMVSELMNLKRGLNPAQIEELTDTIMETCEEDSLALEDFLLFLQKLVRGEYGGNYESMDVPKFMEKFEVYREQRFQALRAIRDEQHAQYSPDYSVPRLSETFKRQESLKNIAAYVQNSLMKNQKGETSSNT